MGGEQSSLSGSSLMRSASVGRTNQLPNVIRESAPTQISSQKSLDLATYTKKEKHRVKKSNSIDESSLALSFLENSIRMKNDDDFVKINSNSDDHQIELLDSLRVEWEGYVEKKGHVVRNWKKRYFTLEGDVLSYYESKENARCRENLKGRVTITEVHLDNRIKSAHGHDFVFETKEGKHFHLSAPTDLDRCVWVHMMEAAIDFQSFKNSNCPIYGNHLFQRALNVDSTKLYSLYRQVLTTEPNLIPEFLFYFSKDLILSLNYPTNVPFHGDLYGREGLLYFLSTLRENCEMLQFSISRIKSEDGQKKSTVSGFEKFKSKINGVEILQPWTHYVEFGPYGRIVKLRIEIHAKQAVGNWQSFKTKNPYSEEAINAFASTRGLSISLHDFTVFHVIGKGGFGTVVNAKKKSDGQIYALKILEKKKMTKYDIDSSFTEMRVGQSIHHPFIAALKIAFQSRTKLFLGMNYYSGGDLFHHMSKGSTCRITPSRARFYSAELILAIHHLHQHDILYRDIKPENVMIDHDGHIALVDFGLAKIHVSDYKGAKTMAGSPQYTAPELLKPRGKRSYGKAADWWSLGILLYEMSIGKSPFFNSNVEKMYQKIQHDDVSFPKRPAVSNELKDLLYGLLRKDPTQRLGNDITDLLQHPFFSGIDWDLLLQREVIPPWRPKLTSKLDIGYIDTEFIDLDASQEVRSPDQKITKGFLSQIRSKKSAKKAKPDNEDPTFKDFNYFCDDPDSLVEFNTLRGELRPNSVNSSTCSGSSKKINTDNSPNEEIFSSSTESPSPISIPPPPMDCKTPIVCAGTPLENFVMNGQLDIPYSPSKPYLSNEVERVPVEIITPKEL